MTLKTVVNAEQFLFVPSDDIIGVFHASRKNILLDIWNFPEDGSVRTQTDFSEFVQQKFATVGSRYLMS